MIQNRNQKHLLCAIVFDCVVLDGLYIYIIDLFWITAQKSQEKQISRKIKVISRIEACCSELVLIIFGETFEILFIVYSWHLLQLRVKDNVMMKYLQMQQYAARIELLCIQFSVTFYNALRKALVAYELIRISIFYTKMSKNCGC